MSAEWVDLSSARSRRAIPDCSGIYVIRNTVNGKEYVGQSVRLARRVAIHAGAPTGLLIHKAIKKYGAHSFRLKVVRIAPPEDLDALEVAEIAERGSMAPGGYNVSPGGNQATNPNGRSGGWRHSEDAKRRMSERKLEYNGMRGRKLTQEECQRRGDARRGKKLAPEICEKFRQAQIGRMSSERAREIAGRPLLAWLPGSLTPTTFASVKEAAEWAGITKATLFKWLAGAARSTMRTKSSDNARAAAAAVWAYARDL